jgi:hypothetical protein
MGTTEVTNSADRTDSAVRQGPEAALQAFAQFLARLVADRSGESALTPRAAMHASAAPVEEQPTGVD